MMNTQEFESYLHQYLFPFFSAHEFELLPQKKQFRRPLANGFQNVILSPSVHEGTCWLEVNLGVRLQAVEHFAQQFLDHREAFRSDANTVVVSIGKLTDNKYFRYKIEDEEDLAQTCRLLSDFMLEQGFSFLEGMSTMRAVDRVFNAQPSKPSKYVYNQVHRCFKGLVVAKLIQNPNFLQVMEVYYEFLAKTEAKPELMNKFDRMASYLLHYSPN